MDLFDKTKNEKKTIEISNGEYLYIPEFYPVKIADAYFRNLRDRVLWRQESMKMYGRQIMFPRLSAWYGDPGKSYSFSGLNLNPYSWLPELLEIKKDIESLSSIEFNSVLLNRYRDGNDSMSWHSDDEKELGKNPIIASINFGAERKFQLKHKETKERFDIMLKHGSILFMMGELQHFWKHQVPKTKRVKTERINLTYRVIK